MFGFGDNLDIVGEVEYYWCLHCGGWEMAVCSLPLYVVGSKDGREYCKCDDCGKTSWRDALEKAQYVRRVSPAMILGLEPVPEGDGGLHCRLGGRSVTWSSWRRKS